MKRILLILFFALMLGTAVACGEQFRAPTAPNTAVLVEVDLNETLNLADTIDV
ncbi:MAG: hypothetical protein GY805_20130, partial [Chloroflexi bacterium]|nr:hypothetical protein [Chloroflexota bacterium]